MKLNQDFCQLFGLGLIHWSFEPDKQQIKQIQVIMSESVHHSLSPSLIFVKAFPVHLGLAHIEHLVMYRRTLFHSNLKASSSWTCCH